MNPYERAARLCKVLALTDVLEVTGCTNARTLTCEQWALAVAAARVKPPSETTKQAVAEALDRRIALRPQGGAA